MFSSTVLKSNAHTKVNPLREWPEMQLAGQEITKQIKICSHRNLEQTNGKCYSQSAQRIKFPMALRNSSLDPSTLKNLAENVNICRYKGDRETGPGKDNHLQVTG